jgi:hypothetical protein
VGRLSRAIVETDFEEVVEAYKDGLLSDEEFRRISMEWFDRYYMPFELEQAED